MRSTTGRLARLSRADPLEVGALVCGGRRMERDALIRAALVKVAVPLPPKRLSRKQTRVLREAVRQREPIAFSAIALVEIAVLFGEGRTRSEIPVGELLRELEANPVFQVFPLTVDVAEEVAALEGSLRDPADRAIVAAARVHRLRLVTPDQRIIESKLVPVVGGVAEKL